MVYRLMLCFIAMLAAVPAAFGQVKALKPSPTTASWPIRGAAAGSNIVGYPGKTVNGVSNYNNLLIGAPEGTVVEAPVDGKVVVFVYSFMETLQQSMSSSGVTLDSAADAGVRLNFAKYISRSYPQPLANIAKYVSVLVGIRTASGNVYYISGIKPTKLFKTGQEVKQGDEIGRVAYAFKKVDGPHISLSRSINEKSADPMTVFGIPSTYVAAKASNVDALTTLHPVDSLKRAFGIFRKSLEEIHPGLYDYSAKATMDSLFDAAYGQLAKPMTSIQLLYLLRGVVYGIHDSHTSIYSMSDRFSLKYQPKVLFTFDYDTLKVLKAASGIGIKAGDKVAKVNGLSADLILQEVTRGSASNEGFIASTPIRDNILRANSYLAFNKLIDTQKPLVLQLSTGKTVTILPTKGEVVNRFRVNSWAPDSIGFVTRMLNPSVGYLDLNTFFLNSVEEDSVESFIGRMERGGIKKLVVDVRDNRGGSIGVGQRIASYFIGEPKAAMVYRMVKSNTTYPVLKYSDNYDPSFIIFPEFRAEAGREGYYCYSMEDSVANSQVLPSDKTRYTGQIYLLVNEYSMSMSSELAALLVDIPNCTIVGRETGSCYYQMNAEKFANIVLPGVKLCIRIPMVKNVFRETPHPRIPYGRGVLPHHEVKLTLDELTKPDDVILEKALQLAAQEGK